MPIFDNNSNKRFVDQKQTGTKNIPFFWNTRRYFKENVYHAIATSCLILFILLALIGCTIFIVYANKYNSTPSNGYITGLGVVDFLAIMFFAICKIAERKIRKQRINDFIHSKTKDVVY